MKDAQTEKASIIDRVASLEEKQEPRVHDIDSSEGSNVGENKFVDEGDIGKVRAENDSLRKVLVV